MIQRWSLEIDHPGAGMESYGLGDYVLYDEHLAELAKLTEEVGRLRKVAEQAIDGANIARSSLGGLLRCDGNYINVSTHQELAQYLQKKKESTCIN